MYWSLKCCSLAPCVVWKLQRAEGKHCRGPLWKSMGHIRYVHFQCFYILYIPISYFIESIISILNKNRTKIKWIVLPLTTFFFKGLILIYNHSGHMLVFDIWYFHFLIVSNKFLICETNTIYMTGKNRATHLKGDNKTPESNCHIRSYTIKCFVFLIEFKVQFLLHNFCCLNRCGPL